MLATRLRRFSNRRPRGVSLHQRRFWYQRDGQWLLPNCVMIALSRLGRPRLCSVEPTQLGHCNHYTFQERPSAVSSLHKPLPIWTHCSRLLAAESRRQASTQTSMVSRNGRHLEQSLIVECWFALTHCLDPLPWLSSRQSWQRALGIV